MEMHPSIANLGNIAVIPARGGSKRIRRKNIRTLAGRPLLYWTIKALAHTQFFKRIVISTEDPEIAAIAKSAGAEVPFMRPQELADDSTSTQSVMSHALHHPALKNENSAHVCCVYPAAIGLERRDLVSAAALLDSSPASFAVAISAYGHPIQRALRRTPNGLVEFLDPSAGVFRTQDLPTRWHDAGQFYMGGMSAWRMELPILSGAVGYPMNASRAVDLDTEDDWRRLEQLHGQLMSRLSGANYWQS